VSCACAHALVDCTSNAYSDSLTMPRSALNRAKRVLRSFGNIEAPAFDTKQVR
jgi:predicted naringenin-chalcone synthase